MNRHVREEYGASVTHMLPRAASAPVLGYQLLPASGGSGAPRVVGISAPSTGTQLAGGEVRGLYGRHVKRLLDILFVVLTLPVALPIILLCALALRMEGGQAFYTQPRLGRGGRSFSIFKLRTMVMDADAALDRILREDPALKAEWDSTQKLKNDPRITRVGDFLRKTSLDELPQLWNVLTGDMSIVGPRPMMPDQLGLYRLPDTYFSLRPGITGLWQVSARNEKGFDYRADMDAEYLRDLSLGADLFILLRTVGVVVRQTGY